MFIERRMFSKERGAIGEVLRVALPLMLAAAGHTINMFVDRLMLQTYSPDAASAAFPAGLTSLCFGTLFFGMIGYANAFVAQYTGAGAPKRVGSAIWQAIWLAFVGGILVAAPALIAEPLFAFVGHEQHLQELEASYFSILSAGSVAPLLVEALITFWSGRGKTHVAMIFELFITAMNIPFNYALIFGKWGAPELGLAGAAYATVAASVIGALVMFAMYILPRTNREAFGTARPTFDWTLIKRMVGYGLPNGMQFFLDLTAFNAFVLLIGRIGPDVLNASMVAFTMAAIALIPMQGFGQAVSILVGQGIGAEDIPLAKRVVKSARFLLACLIATIMLFFVAWPEPVMYMFRLTEGTQVWTLTRQMLVATTGYMMSDALTSLYSSAVRGAGDTKFAAKIYIWCAWTLYGGPCVLTYWFFTRPAVESRLGAELASACNLWTLWGFCILYSLVLAVVFHWRYKKGAWEKMRVIESITHAP